MREIVANTYVNTMTQTTTASGVAGLPDNANLPTSLLVDYVKVTQP